MSHFAKVLNGKVVSVIVAEPEFFNTFIDTTPGEWIQTSYNTKGNKHPNNNPLRGNFAGIGFIYDKTNDVFYEPQPYASWVLNQSTWLWESPIPYPNDNQFYSWEESVKSWVVTECFR
jgi:hypothetical protein